MNYTISKPCSENWDKMKPIEGGRFCDKCMKKVHDFTNGKTLPNTGKSLCGRISTPVPKKITFRKFMLRQSPVKYLAMMFILLFVNKVKAQLSKIHVGDLSLTKESDYELEMVVEISGKLENEKTKIAIADAFVSLYDSNKNLLHLARTDSIGKFTFLVLQRRIADSLFILKAEYFGLETIELTQIPVTKKKTELLIQMAERTSYSTITTVGKLVSTCTITESVENSPYRNTPNKDIWVIVENLSNSPMTRRQERGLTGKE